MQIRPARPRDLEKCHSLDHSYTTDQVWQVEMREEIGVLTGVFREALLPREVRVDYPRQGETLWAGWKRRDGFLVAAGEGQICGYVGITAQDEHCTLAYEGSPS